ncbi:gliding motility-associated C-terminal domain-containing protein [Saprospira sp. CCB-QB6]|uniref:T9SS type B sorting domain-containing protein n=1 Tax=Saprospira sp. CCB-QB6 TaxID=3023936 RepID=UPI00234A1486|nr:gliding motility-associated C-terminal domain-containing protein [Saprospira sp. CCB-QB6]WCL82166.1 gliding motility-associated C-terminal domain-containing protein [Saprospira sp. CCB-QB6]
MKQFFTRIGGVLLLLLLISFSGLSPLKATHFMGFDLTYSCVGPNQYLVTLKAYRDCDGASLGSSFNINYQSTSCGVSGSLSLSRISATDITPLCPSATSACSGGSTLGVEAHVYQGTLNLPTACNDWVLSTSSCCRNNAITNLSGPGSNSIYVETTLDNTVSPCNSSPVFASDPTPFSCTGQQVTFQQLANDVDNDSLVYSLTDCQTAAGTNVTYGGGFSGASPLDVPISLDPATGEISFTANNPQIAVICVLVEEYRNGVKVGEIVRDMQFVIQNCNNQLPTVSGLDGSTTVFDTVLCANSPLCFDILGNDANLGDNITMSVTNAIPGASFTQQMVNGELVGTFCWTPTDADVGSHTFALLIEDDACPLPGQNSKAYTINILPNPNDPVNAGADVQLCLGDTTSLTASTTTSAANIDYFEWTPDFTLGTPNQASTTAFPTGNTNYTVILHYVDGCSSSDQVQVDILDAPLAGITPAYASVCSGANFLLTGKTDASGYIFEWFDPSMNSLGAGTVSADVSTISVSVPAAAGIYEYTLAVTNPLTGCVRTTTAQLEVGTPPVIANCVNIYVSPTGTAAAAGTQADPTSLENALSLAACNNSVLKLAVGTYNIDNPLFLSSFMTVEGGFDPANAWEKTSFAGATTINRTTANPEGAVGSQRLVAFYGNSNTGFRLQDLTITTDDANQPGMSTYGVHLTACSDYDIVRTQIRAGNAGDGADGADGADGVNGGNGGNGVDGDDDGCVQHNGGAAGSSACCPGGQGGGNGQADCGSRDGQNGAPGGCGAAAGGAGKNNQCDFSGCSNDSDGSCSGKEMDGCDGANGVNGVAGTNGVNGSLGSHTGGFFVTGASGTNGTAGTNGTGGGGGGGGAAEEGSFCNNGSGSSGGGGGGGGCGGEAGIGGTSGGASFGLYLYLNGANGRLSQSNVLAGSAGAAGLGGNGGAAGTGGAGGTGGATACSIGGGGDGGDGGNGGLGGDGGDGFPGEAAAIHLAGGSALATSVANFDLLNQPVILAQNVNCINTPMSFEALAASTGTGVTNWNFDPITGAATPVTSTDNPANLVYTNLDRYTVEHAGDSYEGFHNVSFLVTRPEIVVAGATALSTDTFQLCQGDFASFESLQNADVYNWEFNGAIPNPGNVASTSFTQFNVAGFYTITLSIFTDCCGLSTEDTVYLYVDPVPVVTGSGDVAICSGESTTLTLTGLTATDSVVWSPNTGILTSTANSITVAPATTQSYTATIVSVVDHSGVQVLSCPQSVDFEVTVDANPVINFTNTDPLCNNNGQIDATATGGTLYDFSWSTGQNNAGVSTSSLLTIPTGVYYLTVTETSTGCTTVDSSYLYPAPTAPIVFLQSSTQAGCSANDGSATVAGTGGAAPYSFLWSNGGTTASQSNLAPGNYCVTMTDNNGCVSSICLDIVRPDQLQMAVVSQTGPACGTLGAIEVEALGGTATYTYDWSNGATTAAITGLAAGTYDVTITDANGCTADTSLNITASNNPPVLDLNEVSAIACHGDSATLATGTTQGTAPYTYTWTGGSSFLFSTSADTVYNAAAGTYDLIVEDAAGCRDTANIVVSEPASLAVSIVAADVNCNAGNDGSLTPTVTGGTAPYTYLWDDASAQTTAMASSLTVGTYCVTITDANGCSIVDCGTVSEPAQALGATLTVTDASCNGFADGAIAAAGTGGTAPYTYLWNDPATQITATATSLVAGSYCVTVTDNNGCVFTDCGIVAEPTAIQTVMAGTDLNCAGDNSGTATVTVSNGTLPYTYEWDDALTQTTATATSLAAGTYTVTVTDGNACSVTDQQVITEPVVLTATAAATDVNCNAGTDGTASVVVAGGTTPYTYEWDDALTQTTATATGLVAGTYTVTVTDGNACSMTATTTVNEPTALSATTSTTAVNCFAGNDGDATVVVTGGTAPYIYQWDDAAAQTTATAAGLVAGTYNVTITDDHACALVATAVVTEPAAALIATLSANDAACAGTATGQAGAVATDGTAPYSYLWSDGQTTAIATNLLGGNYCVTVTDNNGCTFTDCILVNDPLPIQLTATVDAVSCHAGTDGEIILNASAGTAPYTYNWSNGVNTATNSNLSAGTYCVTVTDNNGCTVDSCFVITEPAVLATAAMLATNPSCFAGADGTLEATVTGGTQPYSYLWSDNQTTNPATNLVAGAYTVTITDANGCVVVDNGTLVDPAPIQINFITVDVTCFGGTDGSASASAVGGVTPYSYSWSNGATTSQITNLAAGSYDLTLTDATGCTNTASVAVGQPTTAVQANILSITQPGCAGDSTGMIDADAQGGTPNYTFSWSTGETTEDLFNLGAGTYTLLATDSRGCSDTAVAVLYQPAAIVLNVQQYSNYNGAAISCPGASDGGAQVTASGGVSPYVYAWSGPQAQNGTLATNLAAGTYAVTVTDASGCTAIDSISLADPVPLDATIQQVNVFCANDCDGQIIATAVSGTGTLGVNGYEYRILGPGQTGNVFSSNNNFTGLCAGTYTVEVRDGNNCVLPVSVTITEPTAIQLSLSDTDVSCSGGSDGTATVSATGGTAPYSYNWDNGMTAATITGLLAGTYEVTVTDANGCDMVSTTEVEEPAALTASMSGNEPSCNGSTDGTVAVMVQGGTLPYTYFWSDGQGTATAVGLSAGTHSVTVTDGNACQLVESYVLGEPTLLTTSITTNAAACAGANSGSATAVPTGGTAPYTYLWSDGQTTATATNLAPGAYSVVVVDSQGCSVTDQVLLQNPDPVVLSFVSSVNPSCHGDMDGSATVVATGGAAPYSYAWPNGEMTASATSLAGGQHTVTATDANGCSTTLTVNLVEPALLVVDTIRTTGVNCKGGSDGTATAFLTGGTLPYSFAWSNGMTGQSISGLAAGTYVLTVTDANGCQTLSQVIVMEPTSALVATLNTADALCFGGASGQITAIVSGGTPNSNGDYTYAWSNGASTDVNSNLSIGTYSVTITDGNGCSVVRTATVNESSGITSQIVNVTDASCAGSADGSAQVTASGGTGTLSYQWSDPLGQTTNVATGLSAGTYYVSVTDLNGCTQVDTAVVGEALALSITVAIEDASCYGESTGSISITNSNEPLQASYWSNGVVGTSITNVAAGEYEVVVQSINGCVDSFSYVVGEPSELSVSLNQVRAVDCYNNSTGALGSTVEGGISPYVYIWSNGLATPSLDSIAAGNYTLNVEDANGCKADTSINLANPTEVGIGNLSIRGVACVDDANGSIQVDGIGGSTLLGGYTYSLDSVNFTGGNLFVGLESGIYPLYIRDNNGCMYDTLVTVEAADPFFLTSFGPALDSGEVEYVLEYGDTLTLFADLNDTTGAIWAWTEINSGALVDSSLTTSLTPYDAGIYQFTATNASGCVQDSSIVVKMVKPRNAAAPTAFTPNSDGNNDRFFIQGDEKVAKVLVFRVYDRWGELVYEGLDLDPNDPQQGWDGSFKGKPMNSGVYAWYAEVIYIDNESEIIHGSVNLLR